MFESLLVRWLGKRFLEVPFEDAAKDQFGNIVLKRSKGVRAFVFITFIFLAIGLGIEVFINSLNEGEDLGFIIFVGFAAIQLGFASIALIHSKTLVEKDGVTAYRFYGEKYISFQSINSVTYTRFFGGCAILRGDGIKILVPIDTCGFYEFYKILVRKLGGQECKVIEIQLQKRRAEISKC